MNERSSFVVSFDILYWRIKLTSVWYRHYVVLTLGANEWYLYLININFWYTCRTRVYYNSTKILNKSIDRRWTLTYGIITITQTYLVLITNINNISRGNTISDDNCTFFFSLKYFRHHNCKLYPIFSAFFVFLSRH